MKKVFEFVFALSIMFLCLGIGVQAVSYYDMVNVGGNTTLAAYATSESKYWAGSVRVAASGYGINVKAKIWVDSKLEAECDRMMLDSSPLEANGVGNKKVHSWGISANYEVDVTSP